MLLFIVIIENVCCQLAHSQINWTQNEGIDTRAKWILIYQDISPSPRAEMPKDSIHLSQYPNYSFSQNVLSQLLMCYIHMKFLVTQMISSLCSKTRHKKAKEKKRIHTFYISYCMDKGKSSSMGRKLCCIFNKLNMEHTWIDFAVLIK